jgi:FkbM family methyltransferase
MSGLLEKGGRVLSDRKMLKAYLVWLTSKTLTGRPPKQPIGNGVRIGEWTNFSEYWSCSTSIGISAGEKTFASTLLNRGGSRSVAFDLGANVGVFTCYLAAAGANQVHSFEPVPDTFVRLKKNVLANKLAERCSLNCLAAGSAFDLVTFEVDATSPGTNGIAGSKEKREQRGSLLQKVATISLDEYCRLTAIQQIDFLKIDVEGMEVMALEGGLGLFREKRVRGVLIEVCPRNLKSAGTSPAALYACIVDVGYQALRLAPDGSPGQRLSARDFQEIDSENVALLPN